MTFDEQQERIYRRLRLWKTEDLLDALRSRDEAEWTPEALAVIERIVEERLGEVPNFEEEIEEDEAAHEDALAGPTPVFYDPEEARMLLALWWQARKWLILGLVAINFWVVWTWHRSGHGELAWWVVDLAVMLMALVMEVFLLWWGMGVLAAMLKALLRIEAQTRPKEETEGAHEAPRV